MRRMAVVRALTSVERTLTNAAAAVLRASMAVLTRLTGRGKHRPWRRRAEEQLRSRRKSLRR
jgi:hypothetical protein